MKAFTSIACFLLCMIRFINGKVVETTGYAIDYYARLDENLVHSLSVKRMWSRARQTILDKQHKSKSSDIYQGIIDEHDPDEKKTGLIELAHQFTAMAANEIFKELFRKHPREDQEWVMQEKNADIFTDLVPHCYIDFNQAHEPIKCDVDFHSLQLVYATYFDLQVELSTKEMRLTKEEKEDRMKPSEKGTTKPIESSNIKMEGKVVTPSKFTRRMKGYDIPLSIDILKHIERKCNRFLATPLPIAKIDEIDSNDISVMHRDTWKMMYNAYMAENEGEEKEKEEDQNLSSYMKTGRRDSHSISIPVDMSEIMEASDIVEEDLRTQAEKDGVVGLEEFLEAFEEECFDTK